MAEIAKLDDDRFVLTASLAELASVRACLNKQPADEDCEYNHIIENLVKATNKVRIEAMRIDHQYMIPDANLPFKGVGAGSTPLRDSRPDERLPELTQLGDGCYELEMSKEEWLSVLAILGSLMLGFKARRRPEHAAAVAVFNLADKSLEAEARQLRIREFKLDCCIEFTPLPEEKS